MTAVIEDFSRAEVEATLAAILADERFANAPQMSAFLAYVVRQTLDGEAERIKAYTVGVDALGKPESFDPQNDPSVRVLAKRLRTFLDAYNARHPEQPLVIELRPGSYKPLFLRPALREGHAAASAAAAIAPSALAFGTDAPSACAGHRRAAKAGPPAESGSEADAGGEESVAAAVTVTPVRMNIAEPSATAGGTPAAAPVADASVPPWMRRGERGALLATLGVGAVAVVATLSLANGPATEEKATVQPTLGGALPAAPPSRPETPVLRIDRHAGASGSLDSRLATLISSAMIGAEGLEIVRAGSWAAWPEHYELTLESVRIGKRVQLEAQLLHSPDGRLVHAESIAIDVDGDADGALSPATLTALDTLATRLAAEDGPLFADYRRQRLSVTQADAG